MRSGQAGPGRLAFLSLLIVLAGATDGLGLALLVPLLNSLGATPQDLLAILQAIKAAGAMNAELEVI